MPDPIDSWRALVKRIETPDQLACLLVLARAPSEPWTLEALTRASRLFESQVEASLVHLVGVQLAIKVDDRAWKLSSEPTVHAATRDLVAVHEDRLEVLLRAMTDDAIERIRRIAASMLVRRTP